MIVDDAGAPVTQRESAKLANLSAELTAEGRLRVSWRDLAGTGHTGDIEVTPPGPGAARIPVTLWGDTIELPLADERWATWLTERVGSAARLAYMPDDIERPVNPRYADPDHHTALTDGYPLHVIGSGSLADLNGRLDTPVGIERFRPNIFISGSDPFDEDDWVDVRVGDCVLKIVKPCPRCTVTTVDPVSAVRGKEPLVTLAKYRRRDDGVMFGQNALHQGRGTLRVGDTVEVLSRRSARPE